MEDFNRVTLTGNSVADVELRSTDKGISVCTMRLAVKVSDKETMFKDVVCWRSTAEYVSKYIHKGDRVLVDGKIREREWTDKNDVKHTITEIEASSVRNISGRKPSDIPAEQKFEELPQDDGDLPF